MNGIFISGTSLWSSIHDRSVYLISTSTNYEILEGGK